MRVLLFGYVTITALPFVSMAATIRSLAHTGHGQVPGMRNINRTIDMLHLFAKIAAKKLGGTFVDKIDLTRLAFLQVGGLLKSGARDQIPCY
jgi:hypothetical protein